jgi:hypothetical protein
MEMLHPFYMIRRSYLLHVRVKCKMTTMVHLVFVQSDRCVVSFIILIITSDARNFNKKQQQHVSHNQYNLIKLKWNGKRA